MDYVITISPGEIYDRVSILKIKTEKIQDRDKLVYVFEEYNRLKTYLKVEVIPAKEEGEKLYKVNKKLWDLENTVRRLEKEKNFGEEFIEAARKIYKYNDKRAAIKNKINSIYKSSFKEVKEHI
jgi:hypothetical protein